MYEFLLFNRDATGSNVRGLIRVLLHIKKHGQLRTLLQICNPFSWSDESYQVSRLNLYYIIAKNFKLFRLNMLNKISLTYLDKSSYLTISVFPSSQMYNANLIRKFQMLETFVMENSYATPFKIKLLDRYERNLTSVEDFISWDPYFFILFCRKHSFDDNFYAYLRHHFSIIFDSINKFKTFEILHHEMSGINFDSILRQKGLNFSILISNAEIWHQRFVLNDNRIINFDATASPDLDFVAGVWPYISMTKPKNSTCALLIPAGNSLHLSEAIFLMGRVDENWYHFLLDTLPRLLFLENLPAHIPLLVRNDIPETSKEFLQNITSRQVIEVDASDILYVGKLHVIPGRSTIFDSRPPKGMSQVELSPLVTKLLRDKVLKVLPINSNLHLEERIFFKRKSVTRNVINWSKIRQILVCFSFREIPLDTEFFRDQVKVFFTANFVVSPGGAVLSNIIFMKPGSKLLALTSFRGRQNNLWRELSGVCGLQYFEVKGVPTFWGFGYLRRLHSNFYVSPRKLRRILSLEI